MVKLGKFILLNLIFTISIGQTFQNASQINERLGRGINMGNAFEAPAENEWGNPWQPEYFQIMAELGFNHVRIPIRWATPERSMEAEPYTIYPDFLERIKHVVDTALKYQLHPVINMHHHEQLFDDPNGQKDRFLAQWMQIADFFKDYPDSLVFELLNEPHGNLTPELWNEFMIDALQLIRVNNPDRVVMIGTAPWGGLQGVDNLEWPEDSQLILTVHYYNPFQFTHQGAEWVDGNPDAWLGTEWNDTQAERDAVISEFEFTRAFAEEKNIPVHVGEFGAYSKADILSRARWTTFLARWFEEQGFSWAYWEFSAGFGIYNPSTQLLNDDLVDALLHNPMPEPTGYHIIPVFENDFSTGTAGWLLNINGSAMAELGSSDGTMHINVSQSSDQPWHIQLVKPGLSIEKDQIYRVTLSAYSDGSRNITTYIGRASDPWDAYSGYHGLTLTTQENEYSFVFTMNSDTDNNARFAMDLGSSDVDVFFTRVTLEKLVLETTVPSFLKPEEIGVFPNPFNESFSVTNGLNYRYFSLYDITGKRVYFKKIEQENFSVELNQLITGMYLAVFSGPEKQTTIRVIKN